MSMKDDDSEAPPTAAEIAEAEALARALEGGAPASEGAAPREALEAAALLRHARRAGAPETAADDRARIAAAAARALPAVDGLATAASRRLRRRRWLYPALLAPAAAAAFALVAFPLQRAGRTPRLRAPPVTLLEAQARAAREGADLGALERQMRGYRAAYYAALAGGER